MSDPFYTDDSAPPWSRWPMPGQPQQPDPFVGSPMQEFPAAQPGALQSPMQQYQPQAPAPTPAQVEPPWMHAFMQSMPGGGGTNDGPAPSADITPNTQRAAPPAKQKPAKPQTFDQQMDSAAAKEADAVSQEQDAARKAADLKAQQTAIEAQGAQEAARQNTDMVMKEQARRAEIQQATGKDMADLQASTAALGQQKIDPGHYWSNMSTFGKVASIIGLALGGFIAPKMPGGRNPALDIIQKQVDEDIQAQRDNMANSRASLEAKSSLYAMNYKRYGDELSAMTATRVQLLEAAKMKTAASAQMFDSPLAQQQGQMLVGQLGAEQAKEMQQMALQRGQFHNQQAEIGQRAEQLKWEKQKFGAEALMAIDDRISARAALPAALAAKQAEVTVFGATDPQSGAPVAAPSKEVAAKANDQIGKYQEAVTALDRLIELRNKYGSETDGVYETDGAKEMNAARIAVIAAVRHEMGERFTEMDRKMIEEQIGNSATSFRSNMSSWQETRNNFIRRGTIYVQSNVNPRAVWTPRPLRPDGGREGDNTERAPGEAPRPYMPTSSTVYDQAGNPVGASPSMAGFQPTPPPVIQPPPGIGPMGVMGGGGGQ